MTDYSNLEDQLGNIGAEPEVPNLGHLEHVGRQQEDLTPEEEASKNAFLRKSKRVEEESFIPAIERGWIPVDRSLLGVREQFYPKDWEFRVKPATVEAIKNWSSIDEDNLAVTNSVFNEIIKSCVSIMGATGKIGWGKMNSWDRFWFINLVREYTFVNGEQKLEYTEECPECGGDVTYELTSDKLVYEFPDPEVVEKHWNQEDRTWYINPKEYDIDAPMVKLYVPTLEKDEAILQWAYAQAQANKQISEPFLRFLPWLLDKAPKNPDLLEKMIREAKQEFNSWDTEMFSFMDEVLRNITINPSEKLKQICPNCGEEVIASVRFPNGIKSIFAIPNKHRKFGSK